MNIGSQPRRTPYILPNLLGNQTTAHSFTSRQGQALSQYGPQPQQPPHIPTPPPAPITTNSKILPPAPTNAVPLCIHAIQSIANIFNSDGTFKDLSANPLWFIRIESKSQVRPLTDDIQWDIKRISSEIKETLKTSRPNQTEIKQLLDAIAKVSAPLVARKLSESIHNYPPIPTSYRLTNSQ